MPITNSTLILVLHIWEDREMVVIYQDDNGNVVDRKKVLYKEKATSILVDKALLEGNGSLTKLADNGRDNCYYVVNDTNVCILHVEDGFNILVDHYIKNKDIVGELSKNNYGVYQDGYNRDWIKNTATRCLIGYDIKRIAYALPKRDGFELDHMAETFNELDKNKRFIPREMNVGPSHRVKIEIFGQDDLNDLINKIRKNEGKVGGIFI